MQIGNQFDYEYFGLRNIAVGNLDQDTAQEMVITGLDSSNNPHAWIIDDASTNFSLLKEINWTDTYFSPSVAIGDINGDGIAEIAF